MVSEEQISFYCENGYLVVPNLVPADELAALKSEVDAIVAESASVTENTPVFDLEDTHSRAEPRVRRIKEPHHHLSAAGRLVRHPGIVGILQALIGPGIRFQTSKLNMKSAAFGAPVEWHQDWAFYPHTNQDLLAVGIMLDDVTLENGPMMVLPGSHKGLVYDHHSGGYFCGAIDV